MATTPGAYVQDQHLRHADKASHPPAPTRRIVLSYALRGTEPMYVWPASPMSDRECLDSDSVKVSPSLLAVIKTTA